MPREPARPDLFAALPPSARVAHGEYLALCALDQGTWLLVADPDGGEPAFPGRLTQAQAGGVRS